MADRPVADGPVDLNAGVLAPVADEVTIDGLDVTGRLPPGLTGTLIRNGPNPFSGRFDTTAEAAAGGSDMLAWWVAPAMVHGVAFADGQARWYRNRWVRPAARPRGQYDAIDPGDGNPNVNVITHGGRNLALGEGGLPFEIGPRLEMVGATDLGGSLIGGSGSGGMTAHPKIDARSGELCLFRSDWQAPYLRYGVLDAGGRRVVDEIIELPGPAMMHDFAITERTCLFLDLAVAYDFSMLQHGAPIPLRWHDDRVSRIGIAPRSGSGGRGEVTWVEIEPCFIQHVINGYDVDDDTVILDVVRYPSFLRFDAALGRYEPNPLGVPWRYTITGGGSGGPPVAVHEAQLDDRNIELPRIDERRTGRHHRYAYAVEQPSDVEMRGVIKYDLSTGSTQHYRVPAGDQNSEPIFVARPGGAGAAEDDGWVLVCVYRCGTDRTDVVILDAADIAAPPVATVHLPRRIPAGFHGAWLP